MAELEMEAAKARSPPHNPLINPAGCAEVLGATSMGSGVPQFQV